MAKLTRRELAARIIEQATVLLKDYPVNLDGLKPRVSFSSSGSKCDVTWKNKNGTAIVSITEVWLGDEGEITQWGSNYGTLTL